MQFAKLMGHFGQTTNALSFVFSLFGFSFVVRTLGLRRTLRVFPLLLLFVVAFSSAIPNLPVLFYSISLLKALTYSLNEPAMELLYMPTSDAVKFKAKAWIDVVGARSMKALGSAITHSAGGNPALLVRYGSVPTLLVSLALFGISILAGRRFEDLRGSGKIVGQDDEVSSDSLTSQNSWYDDEEDRKDYFDAFNEEKVSITPDTSTGWEPALNKIIHSRNHEKVKLPKRAVSDPALGDLLGLPPSPLPPPRSGVRSSLVDDITARPACEEAVEKMISK